jgi:hypothetical protein
MYSVKRYLIIIIMIIIIMIVIIMFSIHTYNSQIMYFYSSLLLDTLFLSLTTLQQ